MRSGFSGEKLENIRKTLFNNCTKKESPETAITHHGSLNNFITKKSLILMALVA